MNNNSSYAGSTLNECLPYIDFPFYNESLIGYLLRLDYLNGFTPSSILKICIKNDIDYHMSMNDYDIENLENLIELNIVSRLTNLSPVFIEKMKISTIRKKLFKYNCVETKKNFSYGEFKICPECIKQWKIPQIYLFDSVNICLLHGLELISHCSCDKKIDLFNTPYEMNCSNEHCSIDISTLCRTVDISPTEYDSEYVFQSILRTYLVEEIALVQKNEELITGLLHRIDYLESIKIAAYKSIFKTNYANENSKIIFQRYNRTSDNLLKLSSIIFLLNEFNISPFQFLNFNSNDFKADITSQIQSITCHSPQVINIENISEMYFYNLKGSKNNLWSQSWQAISARTENKTVIFYDVKITSGRNSFNLKCCACS